MEAESRSDQVKHCNIVVVASPAKDAALGSKSKYWLARHQNNLSEWSYISTGGQLFQ